jgi:hypothetical protein
LVPQELLDWLEYASHAPPAVQQPFAHEDAVHTHWPALLQVSPLLPAVQSLHAAPPVPHDGPDCDAYASHVPDMVQQPVGHVVASHVQVPLVVSHSPLEHDEHVAPAVPHELPDCDAQGSHVPVGPPLQQPFGQEVASQTHVPLAVLHSSPGAHAPQVAPAVPHDAFDSALHASQVPEAVQQPFGHDCALHTQLPVALQSVPAGQAWQAAPPLPQDALDSFAYASHEPLLQQPAQALPPHEHVPLVHVEVAPHAAHMTPPVPHEVFD